MVVPSTYSHITEPELKDLGVNIIIYAHHLIRSAYPAMTKVAESILKNGRSFEADNQLIEIKKILELIPGTK